MTDLQIVLNNIQKDKNENLLPENLRKDITCLGITGTMETGTEINNQDKEITENGTYTADEGYTGLGTVTVNIPSDTPIKLYSSKEEMMADTTEPENEYGVVYSQQLQPIAEGMTGYSIYIPSEFVLTEAVTDRIHFDIRSEDNSVDISIGGSGNNLSGFVSIQDNGNRISSNIKWTSTDGLTFTLSSADKPELLDTVLEFPTKVVFTPYFGDWPSIVEEILKTGGMYFEGMYEWKNEKDDEYFNSITDWVIDGTTVSTINEELFLPQLTTLLDTAKAIEGWGGYDNGVVVVKDGDDYYAQVIPYAHLCIYDVTNNRMCFGAQTNRPTYDLYSLDLENQTYTKVGTYDKELIIGSTGRTATPAYNNGTIIHIMAGSSLTFAKYEDSTYTSNYYTDKTNVNYGHTVFLTWHHVHTEFDLEFKNQLADGVTALGKYGPVTGDGSILNTIEWVDFIHKYRNTADVLVLPTRLNGYHAEKIEIPTEQTIMQGNMHARVFYDFISSDHKIKLTEHYIIDTIKDITKIYNYNGELLYTLNETIPNCFVELPNNRLGYVETIGLGSGNMNIVGHILDLKTDTITDLYNETFYTGGNLYSYATCDDNGKLIYVLLHRNWPTNGNIIARLIEEDGTIHGPTSPITFNNDSISGSHNYTFDRVIVQDANYYYVGLNGQVDSINDCLCSFVFDKTTNEYVGVIKKAISRGSYVVDKVNNQVYCTFGTELHLLNGVSTVKVCDLPRTFGSDYISHAGYIEHDKDNQSYLIGNGTIINLTTQNTTNTITYDTNSSSTIDGKIVSAVWHNKLYVMEHISNLMVSPTGDNILLEAEPNKVVTGYSEYVLLENNAFSHLEISDS